MFCVYVRRKVVLYEQSCLTDYMPLSHLCGKAVALRFDHGIAPHFDRGRGSCRPRSLLHTFAKELTASRAAFRVKGQATPLLIARARTRLYYDTCA